MSESSEKASSSISYRNGKETRLHRIWRGMVSRCHDPDNKDYKYYGKRGIKVCAAWRKDFDTFHDWAVDHGYTDYLTIDRKDNNGDYAPHNCRFATMKVQNQNKSRSDNSFLFAQDDADADLRTIAKHLLLQGSLPASSFVCCIYGNREMCEKILISRLPPDMVRGIIKTDGYNPGQSRDKNGRFAPGNGSKRKKGRKYAASPQRDRSGVQVSPKTYGKLCGILDTQYPGLKKGESKIIRDAGRKYEVTADEFGGLTIQKKIKIK